MFTFPVGFFQNEAVVGLQWNQSADSYARLENAAGQTKDYFNNIYPWKGIKRCVLNNSGEVLAYYGDEDFVEDGSTGQVMVEIPKFYYKAEKVSSTYKWYISNKPRSGFNVHPAFVRDSVEKNYIYMSAYEGCLYDVSASAYITNDAQVANFTAGTGDKLSSIANAKPCSGVSQQLTLPNSRILAHNRGSGWELQDFLTTCAIQLLYLIEYAHFNSQTQIGRGVVDKSLGSGNNSENTGATSSLGNASGMASGTDGLVSISYRGIENFWGNIWTWVDGINIQGDYKPWVADHDFASNKFEHPYTYLNGTLASTTASYIKDILSNSYIDYGFLPTVVGGSENSYLCDYWYANPSNRIVNMGGGWNNESSAGAFELSIYANSSAYSSNAGARLLYIP